MPDLFIARNNFTITIASPPWNTMGMDVAYEPGSQFMSPVDKIITIPSTGFYELFLTTYAAAGPLTSSYDSYFGIQVNGSVITQVRVENSLRQSTGLGSGIIYANAGEVISAQSGIYGGLGGAYYQTEGWTRFSGMKLDTPRIGFLQAQMGADINLWGGAQQTVSNWIPTVDTAACHNGASRFTAPAGTSAALISTGIKPDLDKADDMYVRIYVNGVEVRRRMNVANQKEFGGQFGLIQMAPGDYIEVALYYLNDPSYRVIKGGVYNSSVTIEWV